MWDSSEEVITALNVTKTRHLEDLAPPYAGLCGTLNAYLQAVGFPRGQVLSGSLLALQRVCGSSKVDQQWRSRSCFCCGVQQNSTTMTRRVHLFGCLGLLGVGGDVLDALADVRREKNEASYCCCTYDKFGNNDTLPTFF